MRESLFGSHLKNDVEMGDLDGMAKLRNNTQMLNQGTAILDDTIRVATDTEDTAQGTVQELARHGEVLHSISGHV